MTGKEIFKDAALLTEQNCEQVLPYDKSLRKEYYKNLQACVDVLKTKYKDVITGLWYIDVPAGDGGTQFVYRIKEEISDVHVRNRIHSDIFKFTSHELCFYVTDNSTEDLRCIPIDEWVFNGWIYALYDAERGA